MPLVERTSGPQLVLMYIGSATCPWSVRDSLPPALETIKIQVRDAARAMGMNFKAVGVAIDWDPLVGVEHLKEMGRFDEISAGYNWGNASLVHHVWPLGGNPPATPEVRVFRRIEEAPDEVDGVLHYGEGEWEQLVRREGLQSIIGWAELGAPLPSGEGW